MTEKYSGGVLHHIHALEESLKESIVREQELARQIGEIQDSPCAGCRESVDRATTAEAERDALALENDILRGECRDGEHAPWCREWRKLVSRADIAEAKVAAFERLVDHANEVNADTIARAERAEAQLAALREAIEVMPRTLVAVWGIEEHPHAHAWGYAKGDIECALADTAAAAEAYTRRVRAEALREAAGQHDCDDVGCGHCATRNAQWLRVRADEIEGGREAQLAALREAASRLVVEVSVERTWCTECRTENRSRARSRAEHPHAAGCLLADTAKAAEAYTRRVRVDALREAATECDTFADGYVGRRLLARADQIESEGGSDG